VAGSKRFRRLPHVRFPARRPGPGGDGDGGGGPAASREESFASSDQWTNRFSKGADMASALSGSGDWAGKEFEAIGPEATEL
jgi:hypothetical protein